MEKAVFARWRLIPPRYLQFSVMLLCVWLLVGCERALDETSAWKQVPQKEYASSSTQGGPIFVHVVPGKALKGCFYVTDSNTLARTCYDAAQFKTGEYAGVGMDIALPQNATYTFSHSFTIVNDTFQPLVSYVSKHNKYQLRKYFLLSLLLSGVILGAILYNSLVMVQGGYWGKLSSSVMGFCLLIQSWLLYQLTPLPSMGSHLLLYSNFYLLMLAAYILVADLLKSLNYKQVSLIGVSFAFFCVLINFLSTQSMYFLVYTVLCLSTIMHALRSKRVSIRVAWAILSLSFVLKVVLLAFKLDPYIHLVSEMLLFVSILFLAISQVNAVNNLYQKENRMKEQSRQQVSLISVVSHELRNSAQILASLVERSGDAYYRQEATKLTRLLDNVLDSVYFKSQTASIAKRFIQLSHLTGWKEFSNEFYVELDWDKNFTPLFEVNDRILDRWFIVLAQQLKEATKVTVTLESSTIKICCSIGNLSDVWKESEDQLLLLKLNSLLINLLKGEECVTEESILYTIPVFNVAWNEIRLLPVTSQKKILLVEDEEITRSMIKSWLELSNHEVAECGDGNLVLGLIEDFKPDVLLLDNQLPNKTGVEILNILSKGNKPSMDIILISADLPEFLPGDVRVLQKPLNETSLLLAIEEVSGGRHDGGYSAIEGMKLSQQKKILVKLLPIMKGDLETLRLNIENNMNHDAADLVHKLIGRLSMVGLDEFRGGLKDLESHLRKDGQISEVMVLKSTKLMGDILLSCENLGLGA